jgi:hypothetical protein
MLWRIPADLRRERIGTMFISIDTSTGATRSAAAGTTRTDCRRLFHSRQMSGGKGGNPTAPIRRAGFVNDFDPFSVRRPARRIQRAPPGAADSACAARRGGNRRKLACAPLAGH